MERSFIIFDRQDITRMGTEALLGRLYPAAAIHRVSDKDSLVNALASHGNACVVIDYSLSDINSADAMLNMSARFPDTTWIFFCDELSGQFLRRVVGCHSEFGALFKSAPAADIESAVRESVNYGQYVSPRIKEILSLTSAESFTSRSPLTVTEQEILRAIAMGRTAKDIASSRNASIHTIITHRKNIYRKLEVNNAQEAARYALRAGILDAAEYYI